MNLLHRRAGVLHSVQCLFVDIRSFYAVYLALQSHYLSAGLVESVFELLLPSQGSFRSYMVNCVNEMYQE